jgi:serine/threonine-protein kinase HipA
MNVNPTNKELVALLDGERIGIVEQGPSGDITFTYEDSWQNGSVSYPVSLSMPLARKTHPDAVARPFLSGLLSDNGQILQRWGSQFHVSPRNPFALLTHMGEECAGAIQFVRPERVDAVLSSPGDIDWLTEGQVGDLLRDLVHRHGIGRFHADQGQFSLAGAQPKTALFHDGDKWGIPSGRTPTTHILKPPALANLDWLEINEHFCLNLAAELRLSAARSRVARIGDQLAIIVERYDRVQESGLFVRVHQEDFCQALGVPPSDKYENEGGPGAPEIVELLLRESNDPDADVGAFIDALALNWAIAGSDAHAKNYSIMIRPGSVRLAPLYDLLSALPYETEMPYRKLKLAMRIDREYAVWKIRKRHWEGLARRCELDPQPFTERVVELVGAIPEAAQATAGRLKAEGLPDEAVNLLQETITQHSGACIDAVQ